MSLDERITVEDSSRWGRVTSALVVLARRWRRYVGALREQPTEVIAFRLRQELRLAMLRLIGHWERLARPHSSDQLVERGTTWVAPGFAGRLRDAPTGMEGVRAAAAQVREGHATVMGHAVDVHPPVAWDRDPRTGGTWPHGYWRSFDHYARPARGEVRFPWELGRLGHLLPVCLQAAADRDHDAWEFVEATLRDFERSNPVARTIHWAPMEVAVRLVNLVSMLGLSRTSAPRSLRVLLRRLIRVHVHFQWETIEVSAVPGNHYLANLVGLYVGIHALGERTTAATRRLGLVRERLRAAIADQFQEDGVHVEMSTHYHGLASGLTVVAAATAARLGRLSPLTAERVLQAVTYLRWLRAPDGSIPEIGDGDGARLLVMGDATCPWTDRVAALAATFVPVAETADDGLMACLSGVRPDNARGAAQVPVVGARAFAESGMVVARADGALLVVDGGAVGLHGRGGHGHNDCTSFVWWAYGQEVIVDPGTYLYTGDLDTRDVLRRTDAHNVAQVDGREMAPLLGTWRISPVAAPLPVRLDRSDGVTRVHVGHRGWERLDPPVRLHRMIETDDGLGRLRVTDVVEISEVEREIVQHFHLAPGLEVDDIAGSHAVAVGQGLRLDVRSGPGTIDTAEGWVSPEFGQLVAAHVLRVTTTVPPGVHPLTVELAISRAASRFS